MHNKKHILVVEDERAISEIFKNKLEEEGFRVSMAQNGKDGLKTLQSEHVDLLLLDLLMPVMNGFELLEAVEKNNIQIPIIVFTNLGQRDDIEHVKKIENTEFFIKSDTPLSVIVDTIKLKLHA